MTVLAAMPEYESYKDSGIDWLGEVPDHWQIRRFKFLTSITTGGKNTEDKEDGGEYPFFVRSQIPEKINTYSYDGEAILTAGDGAGVGKVYHYVNGKFDYHQRVYKFSDFTKVSGQYLYRYLYVNFYNVAILGTAKSTVDSLRLPLIQDFNICFPEGKEEQSRIIQYLDKKTTQIDEAIAIKQKQIELLKERKQIIIQKAVTQGLDPNVPMRDSGHKWLGSIPKHWKLLRVKQIFNLVMQPAEKNNNHELLSVYTDIGVKPRKELEERGNKASTTDGYWLVKKGDIIVNKLLAWMGAIGLSNYDGVTSPAYDVLRSTRPIEGMFYHLLFRSDFCSEELKKHSRGIMDMRLRLYFDRFGVVEVPYPPVEEQTKIIAHIEQLFLKIDRAIEHQQAQIQNLKEYKTTLINSAVTGKIKVPNICKLKG